MSRTVVLSALVPVWLLWTSCAPRATPPAPSPAAPASETVDSEGFSKPEYAYVATTELPELDESTIQRVIHVDPSHPGAVDAGDGAVDHPLRTILAARDPLHASLAEGIPTKLLIAPGEYREDLRYLLNFSENGDPVTRDTLLVVEGAEKGRVVISGALEQDPALGDFRPSAWRPVDGEPGLYVNDWPFGTHVDAGPWIDSFGFAMLPGVMQRSEMAWVDGQPLRQILTERYDWVDPDGHRGVSDHGTGKGGDVNNTPGRLAFAARVFTDPATQLTEPGTFAVFTAEEAEDGLRGKVFLRLPENKTLEEVGRIEIGRWKGKAWTPMLNLLNKHNVVLRNLTVTRGTMGQMCSAVNISNCENFLVEDCDVSGNAASGLSVKGSRTGVLRRVTANHNGGNGFNAGGNRQMLYEDCETSFNNLRGGWAGWLGWHASAFKSGNVHHVTVRRHVSVGNYANGLWFDVYCTDILVEDSLLYGNKRMGVMFELTRPNGGPHVLRNSVVAENDNTGVYVTMAANTRVEDNLVVRNGGGGFVESEPKHTQLLYKFRDHPQGPNSPEAWESVDIRGNWFLSDRPDARAVDYLDRKAEPATQYDRVLTVLHSRDNRYGTPEDKAFRSPEGGWLTFSEWRNLLRMKQAPVADEGSVWDLSGLADDRRREFTADADSEVTRRARAMGVPLPGNRIREYWSRVDQGLYSPPHLHYERQHD